MGDYSNFTTESVLKIFNGFACWLMTIVWSLAVIFIIIAGIRWMMAGGEPEKVTSAKKNFYGVLIGLLVIFGVNVILQSVAANLGSTPSLIPFTCPR